MISTNPRDQLSVSKLRHPNSFKWNLFEEDVIPMWIADMDFPVAPPIVEALLQRLTHGIGYHMLNGDTMLKELLREKLATQGLVGLEDDGIALLPGVVPGLYSAVGGLSQVGDGVLTVTPIYHPFHLSITELGRTMNAVPLLDSENGYVMDWEAMETAASKSKLLMLCHPHNPTGRIWTHEELNKLRDLALRHNLYVVSDELHADLRLNNEPFEAFASDPRIQSRTLTVTGPCKAFNTAGLGIGAMIGHNSALVKKARAAAGGFMGHESALSVTMWQAALKDGGPWLAETITYLKSNRDFLTEYLQTHLPWVRFHPAESTYLAWLDLRAHAKADQIHKFLLDEAKVAIHDGPVFAPQEFKAHYQGFIRLNFATSREILTEALERMRGALG